MSEEENSITNEEIAEREHAVLSHVVPFFAWILLLMLLEASGTTYAVRTVVGAGLLIFFRPWRYYERFKIKHFLPAVGVGVLVCLIWIGPELVPGFQTLYQTVGMVPPWSFTEVPVEQTYAPENCGWAFSLIRLAGSAFVIAIIEEFFWRGFLYRWMLASPFLKLDLGKMQVGMFLLIALFFGLEHTRWVVGFAAGVAYGLLVIKTKDIWAGCIAHITTNLLLGIYVLATESYQFW